MLLFVIPANAGIHGSSAVDPGFRRGDEIYFNPFSWKHWTYL
jgi:hypothetical protein